MKPTKRRKIKSKTSPMQITVIGRSEDSGFNFTADLGSLSRGKEAIAEMLIELAAAVAGGHDLTGCGFDLHHTKLKPKKARR